MSSSKITLELSQVFGNYQRQTSAKGNCCSSPIQCLEDQALMSSACDQLTCTTGVIIWDRCNPTSKGHVGKVQDRIAAMKHGSTVQIINAVFPNFQVYRELVTLTVSNAGPAIIIRNSHVARDEFPKLVAIRNKNISNCVTRKLIDIDGSVKKDLRIKLLKLEAAALSNCHPITSTEPPCANNQTEFPNMGLPTIVQDVEVCSEKWKHIAIGLAVVSIFFALATLILIFCVKRERKFSRDAIKIDYADYLSVKDAWDDQKRKTLREEEKAQEPVAVSMKEFKKEPSKKSIKSKKVNEKSLKSSKKGSSNKVVSKKGESKKDKKPESLQNSKKKVMDNTQRNTVRSLKPEAEPPVLNPSAEKTEAEPILNPSAEKIEAEPPILNPSAEKTELEPANPKSKKEIKPDADLKSEKEKSKSREPI
ncbi:unnamed protein product [Caenorhabditis auriculariae]|uniref:Uncharacterized protein n=1 Tax=Caenorhabditis auriculariae TaxID=2777116 RepID=A0A8S1HD83_9PELO|nr:unnamed protein product [Caenorhabditis auriculariae]